MGYSDINGPDYTPAVDRTPLRYSISNVFERMPEDQEVLYTLIGAAPGALAQANRPRVQHSQTELGGVRVIENHYKVNRNTTADDVTAMQAMVNRSSRIPLAANKAGLFLGKAG